MTKNIILLLAILLLCTGCPKGGGSGSSKSILPDTLPSPLITVHSKWLQPRVVYVPAGVFNGYDAQALTKTHSGWLNNNTDFKLSFTDDPAKANVLVKFYNAPWTPKKATSDVNVELACRLVIDSDSKSTSAVDVPPTWTPPTPEDNLAGLTYQRVDNTTRESRMAVIYLNAFMLNDGKGFPKSFGITVEHEFGHLSGLNHTQEPQAIMFPRIGPHTWQQFELDTINALY